MPIPLLIPIVLGGAAAAATALGVKKAYEGTADIRDANRRGENARKRHDKAARQVDKARDALNGDAVALGELKAKVVATTMADVVEFLRRIEQRSTSKTIETLEEVGIDREDFDRFRADVLEARTAFGSLASAATAGVAAGKAALAGAGLVGVASTGAAIGGLSGAAAQSATMAWLGGGALAAGGGGMALGAAILGGVVVGPAVFVTGFALAAQGEKAQTKIRKYEREVKEACAQCRVLEEFLEQARRRVRELSEVLSEFDARVQQALGEVDGDTWDERSEEDVRRFRYLMILAKALGDVMRAPVLDHDGNLASTSANLRFKYKTLLE